MKCFRVPFNVPDVATPYAPCRVFYYANRFRPKISRRLCTNSKNKVMNVNCNIGGYKTRVSFHADKRRLMTTGTCKNSQMTIGRDPPRSPGFFPQYFNDVEKYFPPTVKTLGSTQGIVDKKVKTTDESCLTDVDGTQNSGGPNVQDCCRVDATQFGGETIGDNGLMCEVSAGDGGAAKYNDEKNDGLPFLEETTFPDKIPLNCPKMDDSIDAPCGGFNIESDRSSVIIHKDLYITNRILEKLKQIEKKSDDKSISETPQIDKIYKASETSTGEDFSTPAIIGNVEDPTLNPNPVSAVAKPVDFPCMNFGFDNLKTDSEVKSTVECSESSVDANSRGCLLETVSESCDSKVLEVSEEAPLFSAVECEILNAEAPHQIQDLVLDGNIEDILLREGIIEPADRKENVLIFTLINGQDSSGSQVINPKMSSQVEVEETNEVVEDWFAPLRQEIEDMFTEVSSRRKDIPVAVENDVSLSKSSVATPCDTQDLSVESAIFDNTPTGSAPSRSSSIRKSSSFSNSNSRLTKDTNVETKTETTINCSRTNDLTDINILETQRYVDKRLPYPFSTETILQVCGTNESLDKASRNFENSKNQLVHLMTKAGNPTQKFKDLFGKFPKIEGAGDRKALPIKVISEPRFIQSEVPPPKPRVQESVSNVFPISSNQLSTEVSTDIKDLIRRNKKTQKPVSFKRKPRGGSAKFRSQLNKKITEKQENIKVLSPKELEILFPTPQKPQPIARERSVLIMSRPPRKNVKPHPNLFATSKVKSVSKSPKSPGATEPVTTDMSGLTRREQRILGSLMKSTKKGSFIFEKTDPTQNVGAATHQPPPSYKATSGYPVFPFKVENIKSTSTPPTKMDKPVVTSKVNKKIDLSTFHSESKTSTPPEVREYVAVGNQNFKPFAFVSKFDSKPHVKFEDPSLRSKEDTSVFPNLVSMKKAEDGHNMSTKKISLDRSQLQVQNKNTDQKTGLGSPQNLSKLSQAKTIKLPKVNNLKEKIQVAAPQKSVKNEIKPSKVAEPVPAPPVEVVEANPASKVVSTQSHKVPPQINSIFVGDPVFFPFEIPSVKELVRPSPISVPIPADENALELDFSKMVKEMKTGLPTDEDSIKCNVPLSRMKEFPMTNETRDDGYNVESPMTIDGINDIFQRNQLSQMPAVTKILGSTMSSKSQQALDKWKQGLISSLGDDGFKKFLQNQLKQGSDFHSTVAEHLLGRLRCSDTDLCMKSMSSVFKHISNIGVVESQVIHPHLAYRGVIDCVAKYKGKPVVIEWKKSDKSKPTIKHTYDAPLQLSAYVGAMNFDRNYKCQVEGGLIVVAYSDGSPADVFEVSMAECDAYWKKWLKRLHQFYKKRI